MAHLSELLLLYGALSVVLAPVLLMRRPWMVRRPRLALGSWLLAFAAGVLSTCLGSMWWLAERAVADTGSTSWDAALFVGSWVVLAAGSGMVAAVLLRASFETTAHRQHRMDLRAALGMCRSEAIDVDGHRVNLVHVDEPFATHLPGRDAHIVVSTALSDVLSPAQLRAVVLHEAAHLRLRHDLLLRLARIHERCIPVGRGPEEMRRSLGLIVELIADDRAVRRCEPDALAGALSALSAMTKDPTLTDRKSVV